MGSRARAEARAAHAVAAVALLLAAGAAHADPVMDPAAVDGAGLLATTPGDARATASHTRVDDPPPPALAAPVELGALAVPWAAAAATWPEVGAIATGEPALRRARVGLVGRACDGGWRGVVRLDLAEGLRLDGGRDRPLPAIDRVVDDAALGWAPRRWFAAWAGRLPVPFARFGGLEPGRQLAGRPATIDRVAPWRRWGAAVAGDLGSIGYAVGGFADLDRLERLGPAAPLDRAGDPSLHGGAALAARIEWTPRAPVGRDHLPSASGDPWRAVPRVSAGTGALVRLRGEDRPARVDLAGSVLGLYRATSAAAEVVVAVEDGAAKVGAIGEVAVLIADRLAPFVRGELDGEAARWAAGVGAAWLVSPDRLDKLSVFGVLGRGRDAGAPRRDGVVVELQLGL
jgi:hypothetical protein